MFSDKRLKFGGYAFLIALPALVLAGLGGLSLRDDSIAAALDVKERGELVIAELRMLRKTLKSIPSHSELGSWMVLVGDQHQLLDPAPIDYSIASSSPAEEVPDLLKMVENAGSEAAVETALMAVEEAEISKDVRAALLLRLASAQSEYSPTKAEAIYRQLLDDYFFERSETGILMGVLSGLWLTDRPESGAEHAKMVEVIGQRLLKRPEPYTEVYLESFDELLARHLTQSERVTSTGKPSRFVVDSALTKARVTTWDSVQSQWRADQLKRAFYRMAKIELHLAEVKPRTSARMNFRGEDLLVWFVGDEKKIYGRSYSSFRQGVDQALSVLGVNEFFQTSLVLEGQVSFGLSGGQEVARAQLDADSMWPGATAIVSLTEPELYFASVKQRRWRFGFLIGLALLSVAFGLIAIYRTFRRQQRVNEQRSNFVASVSHELRTPAASLSLMSEELLAGDCDKKRYHELIHSESQRLSALVENVLDVSRIERGAKEYEFEACELVGLVETTIDGFRPAAGRLGISMDLEKQEGEMECVVDPIAIQRALRNLLDNAVKFSIRGNRVQVAMRLEKDTLVIEVSDQGKGIDSQALNLIFEPFQRLGSEMRRESAGVGLGLALVKHVVEAHQGSVEVESEEGKGSLFRIRIPRGMQNE
jgi:signal transduction histidine kinase